MNLSIALDDPRKSPVKISLAMAYQHAFKLPTIIDAYREIAKLTLEEKLEWAKTLQEEGYPVSFPYTPEPLPPKPNVLVYPKKAYPITNSVPLAIENKSYEMYVLPPVSPPDHNFVMPEVGEQ